MGGEPPSRLVTHASTRAPHHEVRPEVSRADGLHVSLSLFLPGLGLGLPLELGSLLVHDAKDSVE